MVQDPRWNYQESTGQGTWQGETGNLAGMGDTPIYDYNKNNPRMAAMIAAQNQGQGQGQGMFGSYLGGGNAIGQYLQQMMKNQFGNRPPPEIPKATEFGFNLPTLGAAGKFVGGFGKAVSGMADWKLAGVAEEKFKSDQAQILDNIRLAKIKRAGDVVAWNNPVGRDRAFEQVQGYSPDQLSKFIPQAAGYEGFGTETRS